MRRVAITGIGIVSPFGRGKRAAVDALRAGRSGVRLIESIDTAALNCRIGGEVPRQAHEGLVKGSGRSRLRRRRGGRTRFTWAERLVVPWRLGGPVGAFATAIVLRRVWAKNLAQLKAVVEGARD